MKHAGILIMSGTGGGGENPSTIRFLLTLGSRSFAWAAGKFIASTQFSVETSASRQGWMEWEMCVKRGETWEWKTKAKLLEFSAFAKKKKVKMSGVVNWSSMQCNLDTEAHDASDWTRFAPRSRFELILLTKNQSSREGHEGCGGGLCAKN